jgi:hypothetical protein
MWKLGYMKYPTNPEYPKIGIRLGYSSLMAKTVVEIGFVNCKARPGEQRRAGRRNETFPKRNANQDGT